MTVSATPASSKRTTVRSVPPALRAIRLGLRVTSSLAPQATDRITAKLFFKTRRARTPEPHVEGLQAHPFTVSSSFGPLAAWSWGAGPTVLFVHGWEGHAGQVEAFVPGLVQRGYRVVTFDMPAHGKSAGTHTSAVDMAQAIREVSEDATPFLGVQRGPLRGLIAHSLGGAASVLALTEGLAAERAVLLAPVAEPTPFARRAAEFLQLSPARTDGMLRGVAELIGRDFHDIDGRRLAARFRIPALVMHDPDDREVPIAHGRGIAAIWPGAEFIALQGLGHRRLLKDPAVVQRTIEFITAAPF
jgi:pimeloyl-ACP methyl ester carboxylesterase